MDHAQEPESAFNIFGTVVITSCNDITAARSTCVIVVLCCIIKAVPCKKNKVNY
jgi:hypothetical protein